MTGVQTCALPICDGVLETPFGTVELDDRRAQAVGTRDLVLVGVRPEHFEDAALVERPGGTTFTAQVDVTEWLGDAQYAYLPYTAPEAVRTQLRDLSRELDSEQLRTQAIVSIDSASRIREGREARFWFDTRKVHVFDPHTGENLTRDAEAGAELTRMAAEDRAEQVETARNRGTTVTGKHHAEEN